MSILLQMIGLVAVFLMASWALTFVPSWVMMGALLGGYFCLLAMPSIRLEWRERHARHA